MPSPPKIFIHNTVVMITSRTEEGLPFVPTAFMNEIVWSALAAAQSKYWVELIDFAVEGNHLHIILRVIDPENVPLFVGYAKQEIAHRVNRLLGRRKRTIWAEGYDSPTILDLNKTLDQIAYVMLNPVKDHIVERIEQYPGVTSAEMFKNEHFTRSCTYIPRNEVLALKNPHEPWKETKSIMRHFETLKDREGAKKLNLVLSPYAWKHCFDETKERPDSDIRAMMLERIRTAAEEIQKERVSTGRNRFPSASDLVRQSMLKPYQPKSFGKRMWCLSVNKDLRRQFIRFFKASIAKARDVLAEWAKGIYTNAFPAGLFPPGRRTMASVLSWAGG
jgi:REP element-mobilizing transposase RayT